jgi:O-antigen ligase
MLIAYIFGVNTVNERISISYLGIRKDGNYLSAFLVPGYMIWLYSYLFGKKRLWKFIIAALIFVAIYLTGSRAAFLTMGIVTLLIISKLIFSRGITFKKITLTILLFITAFTGYYYLQSTVLFDRMITADSYTDNIRLQIWEYALEGFYNNPWLGSGIESGTYYAQLHLRWYTHSCFIDILTGQGIVGIALFAVIFIHYMRVKKVNFIFMTTLIISFFLPLNFVNGYESATFWVPMAICAIVSEYCKINNSINIIN